MDSKKRIIVIRKKLTLFEKHQNNPDYFDVNCGAGRNRKLCNDVRCINCYERSFASCHRSIQWSKRNGLSPREITKHAVKKYWFDCDCGHSFDSLPGNIVKGAWCPYCSVPIKKLCDDSDCKMCFINSFASHEKSEFWSDENNISPRNVIKTSTKKYYFDCECGHELYRNLVSIIWKDNWCKYCANKELCGDQKCQSCCEKSFASDNRAKNWSKRNKKTPRETFKFSRNKGWFECDKCYHEFSSTVESISRGCWCPYCDNKKLCDDPDCNYCFQQSFASHEKAKFWSKKNPSPPRNYMRYFNLKHWFSCDKCSHDFMTSLGQINIGNWCPYCANKILCENEVCAICYDKSMANHWSAQFWSHENDISPRQVFKGSQRKYIFICAEGHRIFKTPNCVVYNNWCPHCRNKTENMLREYLETIFPDIIHQQKFDWCYNEKTNRKLPFDFFIPSLNIIIELDGPQHFEQISNWKSPDETRERDIYKMKLCLEHNISIIRLLWEDVYYDKVDWKNPLAKELNMKDLSSIIYLGEHGKYQGHIELMS